MKNWTHIACVLIVLIGSISVSAQERWSAEFRPGINFPTTDLGMANLETGFGFELVVAYKLMPHLKASAGWGWNEFKTEAMDSRPQIVLGESGYTFGFELTLPVSKSPLTYYLYGGGLFEHLELENKTTGSKDDTDFGLGWQLGGGVNYEFAPNWSVRPDLRFRSLSRDNELAGLPGTIDLRYISFGIGLLRAF